MKKQNYPQAYKYPPSPKKTLREKTIEYIHRNIFAWLVYGAAIWFCLSLIKGCNTPQIILQPQK